MMAAVFVPQQLLLVCKATKAEGWGLVKSEKRSPQRFTCSCRSLKNPSGRRRHATLSITN
jgi:hypothetical protein